MATRRRRTRWTLLAVAAGAAAQYFLDPDRGRARRAYVAQKTQHIIKETGTAFRRTGRHLMNKLRVVAHETRGQFSRGEDVTGERLLQRIRSEMGHVMARPTDVQLMADAGGVVTVYGRVPASEMDKLLATINRVPGVNRIVNRAEVQDYTGGTEGSTTGVGSAYGQTAPQM